jgi:hypothetical protein
MILQNFPFFNFFQIKNCEALELSQLVHKFQIFASRPTHFHSKSDKFLESRDRRPHFGCFFGGASVQSDLLSKFGIEIWLWSCGGCVARH